jgi:hypothetical protein
VELSADDAPVGPINVGADGVDPRSGDDAGTLHRDLVVWGTDSCTPGHTTLGNTVPTLESSGAVGPGVVGLLLSGYPDSPFSPVDCGKWRIVRSRHVNKSRLLRECCTRHWPRSAGISCIQFGLVSRKWRVYLSASISLRVLLHPLAFASTTPVPGHCWRAHATGGGDPGTGGRHCYGGFCSGVCCGVGEYHGSCPRCGGPSCPS